MLTVPSATVLGAQWQLVVMVVLDRVLNSAISLHQVVVVVVALNPTDLIHQAV
jgi:hypothetical protein